LPDTKQPTKAQAELLQRVDELSVSDGVWTLPDGMRSATAIACKKAGWIEAAVAAEGEGNVRLTHDGLAWAAQAAVEAQGVEDQSTGRLFCPRCKNLGREMLTPVVKRVLLGQAVESCPRCGFRGRYAQWKRTV
jgi:hypothetical protein